MSTMPSENVETEKNNKRNTIQELITMILHQANEISYDLYYFKMKSSEIQMKIQNDIKSFKLYTDKSVLRCLDELRLKKEDSLEKMLNALNDLNLELKEVAAVIAEMRKFSNPEDPPPNLKETCNKLRALNNALYYKNLHMKWFSAWLKAQLAHKRLQREATADLLNMCLQKEDLFCTSAPKNKHGSSSKLAPSLSDTISELNKMIANLSFKSADEVSASKPSIFDEKQPPTFEPGPTNIHSQNKPQITSPPSNPKVYIFGVEPKTSEPTQASQETSIKQPRIYKSAERKKTSKPQIKNLPKNPMTNIFESKPTTTNNTGSSKPTQVSQESSIKNKPPIFKAFESKPANITNETIKPQANGPSNTKVYIFGADPTTSELTQAPQETSLKFTPLIFKTAKREETSKPQIDNPQKNPKMNLFDAKPTTSSSVDSSKPTQASQDSSIFQPPIFKAFEYKPANINNETGIPQANGSPNDPKIYIFGAEPTESEPTQASKESSLKFETPIFKSANQEDTSKPQINNLPKTPKTYLFEAKPTTASSVNSSKPTQVSQEKPQIFKAFESKPANINNETGKPQANGSPSNPRANLSTSGTTKPTTSDAMGTSRVRFIPPTGTDTIDNIKVRYQYITSIKEYENKSLEELRFEDYIAGRKGRSLFLFESRPRKKIAFRLRRKQSINQSNRTIYQSCTSPQNRENDAWTEYFETSTQNRETPAQHLDNSTQNRETPTKKFDTPTQNRETPPQHLDNSTQNRETPTQKFETPTQNRETPTQNFDTSTQNQEKPTQKFETPFQNRETPTQHFDTSTQNREIPTQHFDTSTQNRETPTEKFETPTQNRETPAQHFDTSTQNREPPTQDRETPTQHFDTSTQNRETPTLDREKPSQHFDTSTQNRETPTQYWETPDHELRVSDENAAAAERLLEAGKTEEAVKICSDSLKLDPKNVYFLVFRARAYYELKKYREALEDAQKAVGISPNSPGYVCIAKCCLALGQIAPGEQAVRHIMERAPSLPEMEELREAFAGLRSQQENAQRLMSQRKYFDVINVIDWCLKRYCPACSMMKLLKAECLAHTDKFQEARSIAIDTSLLCTSAQASGAVYADAVYVIGLCSYFQEHDELAIKNFRKVLEHDPDHRKAVKMIKLTKKRKSTKLIIQKKEEGNKAFNAGQWTRALMFYNEALSIDKNNKEENAKLHYNRATVFAKQNQPRNAIDACTAALELDENYIKALLRRAQCYTEVGMYEEALEDYEKLYYIDSSDENKRLLQEANETLMSNKGSYYYYKILGISKAATLDEIKKAYKKCAMLYHPDRHPGATLPEVRKNERKFKQVKEAYDTLGETRSRANYDQIQSRYDNDRAQSRYDNHPAQRRYFDSSSSDE